MPSRAASASMRGWSRSMVRLVSVAVQWECLAILYLSMTRPSLYPILSAPRSRPLPTAAGIGAGGGDPGPVADGPRRRRPEPGRHDLAGVGERGRVAGVAREDPDRDRRAVGVGEQPVLDLRQALLPVAGVAARGERAVCAGDPGG